ncbi:MAG: glycosyltransferase family 2 protein [Pseudomonadota bacterium]
MPERASPLERAAPWPVDAGARGRRLGELVTVVIVAYRSETVIPGALSSVPPGVRVIVVDNASPDLSSEKASATGATVIANERNVGFGAGCNLGVTSVRTRYTLFLNPDARLSPGSLERLVAHLAANPSVAAVAPLLSRGGQVQLPRRDSVLALDRPHSFNEIPKETHDVGFLSGAALLVRTDQFRAIGGFDERIFLYLEDDDLCMRLRHAGYRLHLMPNVVVAHEKKALSACSPQELREQSRHTLLSTRYLARKYNIDVDFREKRVKAIRRLLIAMVLFDYWRFHANIGRLQGLGIFPTRR